MDSPEVQAARENMINHPLIKSILDRLTQWPGPVVNSHKSAHSLFHLLSFIADLGFTQDDEPLPGVINKVLESTSESGAHAIARTFAAK
jgi:hypothetical protein